MWSTQQLLRWHDAQLRMTWLLAAMRPNRLLPAQASTVSLIQGEGRARLPALSAEKSDSLASGHAVKLRTHLQRQVLDGVGEGGHAPHRGAHEHAAALGVQLLGQHLWLQADACSFQRLQGAALEQAQGEEGRRLARQPCLAQILAPPAARRCTGVCACWLALCPLADVGGSILVSKRPQG